MVLRELLGHYDGRYQQLLRSATDPIRRWCAEVFAPDDSPYVVDTMHDYRTTKSNILTATYRSPLFISAGSSTVTGVKAAIPMWNSYLQEQAKAFGTMNSDATVQILDTTPIFNNILNHPRKFGAPNATCFDADGTSCLWWNNYHPGQAIQKAVGVGAYGQLFGKGSVGLLQS